VTKKTLELFRNVPRDSQIKLVSVVFPWWARQNSNLRPLPCQGSGTHVSPTLRPVSHSLFVNPIVTLPGFLAGIGLCWDGAE